MSAGPDLALVENTGKSMHAEGDHRIANSLAMIAALVRVQAGALGRGPPLEAKEAQTALEEAASRIEAVAGLHRLLSAAPEGPLLDPAQYLGDICAMAQRAFDRNERLSLRYELVEGIRLDVRRVVALGLIVNEAIINTLKYAHPSGVHGQAMVVCRPLHGNSLLVSIEDDGVGLPAHVEKHGGGLGFRIMRSLATELDGQLSFRTSPLGLTVQLLVRV